MAKYVHEIMNPELFSVEPESPRDDVLDFILALGVTAAPVVDEDGKLVGIVSLRDLMSDHGGGRIDDRMQWPVATVDADATVDDAARVLSMARVHRLVAVDAGGKAVGMVSAVDLVRALVGEPVRHPPSFPNEDAITGLSWSDEVPFREENSEQAPSGPGLLVLIYGQAGHRETTVWAEAPNDVRARLDDMLSNPQGDNAQLAHLLDRDRRHLRFRCASVGDSSEQAAALKALQSTVKGHLLG